MDFRKPFMWKHEMWTYGLGLLHLCKQWVICASECYERSFKYTHTYKPRLYGILCLHMVFFCCFDVGCNHSR